MAATRDYLVRFPRDVLVAAACSQVRCDNWLYGWDTILDERTAEGADAANWIRSGRSGRDYAELGRDGDSGVTVFRFSPHQRCFTDHQTRRARFIIGGVREVPTLGDWIGDLDDHVNQLADQARKG